MHPADRLHCTLDDLHEAARHGDFAALAGLAERIASDLAELEHTPVSATALVALRLQATRISPVLEAVRHGVTAARLRLAEIERLRTGPVTYGEDGQRLMLTGPTASLRRV